MKLNDSFLGFTDNKNPMQRAKVESTLEKLVRCNGVIMPRKDFIFVRLLEGCTPVCKENVTRYGYRTGDRLAPRTEYRLACPDENSHYEINKTEHEFAQYLIENKLASEKAAEAFIAAENEQKISEQKIREAEEKERLEAEESDRKAEENYKIWLETQVELYDDQDKIQLQREIFLHMVGTYYPRAKDLLVMIDNIDIPRCREGLLKRLWYGNKASKKTFECVTGIKLPQTDKAARELLSVITPADYKGMKKFKPRKEASPVPQESFYILSDGAFQEVLAEPLSKYGLEMFICKRKERYTISDARSGVLMATGKTKQDAIDELKRLVDKLSVDGIKKETEKLIAKNGTSPRYRDAA